MAKDLYETLGVARGATQDEVRRAYLKLAHKYHPDKTGGDKAAEDKLKEINAAYDTLKNPEKRKKYDQFGSADGSNPFGGAGGAQGFGGGGFETPFEDFFDVLFGQGQGGGRRGGRGGAQPGADLELRLTISLKDAAFGVSKKVRFNRNETCGECKGTGAAAGSKPETCSQCQGAGQVRVAHGFFSVTRTCPSCRGAGQKISNPCRRCSGQGQVKNSRELSVDVPAGVDTGSRLRVTGEGEPGPGNGPRGDLYIYIEIEPHKHFKRDGTTIHCEVPISITQAALGASLRVPTLHGEADLKVPEGTQSGAQFRLRNMGMPDLRGYGKGDQIVTVQVETPEKLTKRQRELLEEFQKEAGEKTYPRYRRFMDSILGGESKR